VQCVQRALAGVDPAAGELELALGLGLLGDQQVTAVADDRIGAGAGPIDPSGNRGLAEPPHAPTLVGPPGAGKPGLQFAGAAHI
jgi:hypothetical protein